MKLLFKLLLLIAAFFALWFLLSRGDWMSMFKLEKAGEKTEEKLGKLSWDLIQSLDKEVTNEQVISILDTILIRICDKNEIDRESIKLKVIEKSDVNAFALPDNYLVLYTGLITECQKPEELAGVMAHEIAHMEKEHIMQKLIKETGLSVLISMTTGNGNPEIMRQIIKAITSSAYDRSLEREADLTGADYLVAAEIDPAPFAEFLFRLSAKEKDLPDEVFWVSSHPGSEERAKDIIEHIHDKQVDHRPVLDSIQWSTLQTLSIDPD